MENAQYSRCNRLQIGLGIKYEVRIIGRQRIMANKAEITGGILGIFITTPIWFYLLYWMLSQLNPDRLVWFLYWSYVPITVIAQVLIKLGTESS